MEKELYWIWFSNLSKMDKNAKANLLATFGNAENIYNCIDFSDISYLSLKDKTILKNKNLETAQQILEESKRLGQTVITYDSKLYPSSLRQIYNPPYVLYAKGTIPDWDARLMIAIVGTRECTKYGLSVVRKLARELAATNTIIVSGMARGIDSESAIVTLENGGFTIAVLGAGVDVTYPPENKRLMDSIAENGLLLSEFPPGSAPLPHHFPMRNRIISGLSHGVLVVESSKKGGSLITANLALEQGKDVFSVPGSIFHNESEGTNQLISNGQAKAVMSANDILCEYSHLFRIETHENVNTIAKQNLSDIQIKEFEALSESEQKIANLLVSGALHADELARLSGIGTSELTSILSMLEFGGYIKKESGNYYKLNI